MIIDNVASLHVIATHYDYNYNGLTLPKQSKKAAAADRHDRPYCIVFSYWQRRISTVLQKFNARILYLAQCKIDGTRPGGGLGFANELKEIMFEEERFYGSSMYV